MTGFGTRTGFVGSMVEGEDGLVVLRGEQGPAAVARVAEHLQALVAAGVRHIRVDAHGASGLDAALLPVLSQVQTRLTVRQGMLTATGLRATDHPGAAAVGSPRPLRDLRTPPRGATTLEDSFSRS